MISRLRLTTASSPPLPAESSSSSCGLPIRFRLLPTLPRGNAVIFSYRALAYPGKDLHPAGCAPSRTHGSPRAARTAISGVAVSCLLLLARQEKWVGCRAGTRPGRLAGHAPLLHPPTPVSREAAFDVAKRSHSEARLDCHACLADEAPPLHCRGGKPGIRPGGRPAFCFAKKWGKKATPMMAVRGPRCARTAVRP